MSQTDSRSRQKRAEQVEFTRIERIDDRTWEVDLINDRGKERKRLTIIPASIYSPSQDMQYRGHEGVVGKYIRALAMEEPEAMAQLQGAIRERRENLQSKMMRLKEKESNLLHAQHDLRGK